VSYPTSISRFHPPVRGRTPSFASMPRRSTRKAPDAPLPIQFRPQLASLVSDPPAGNDWAHELKYDGYRIGCFIEGDHVRLISRNGNDWTAQFPEVRDAARILGTRRALLDGEVAILLP